MNWETADQILFYVWLTVIAIVAIGWAYHRGIAEGKRRARRLSRTASLAGYQPIGVQTDAPGEE